jgi:hypothetical protein
MELITEASRARSWNFPTEDNFSIWQRVLSLSGLFHAAPGRWIIQPGRCGSSPAFWLAGPLTSPPA